MKIFRIALVAALLAGAVLAAWLFLRSGQPSVSREASKVDASALKDPALLAKGEYLTLVGDCVSCHTEQGGPRFAGGRVVGTPFGDIPAPNLTPDRETGLGDWSFEAF